ncbi:hypothetical protein [Streptomyces hygroscopicus]|uniref:hypothetical protein n=1 Tax=Streptomyces hygroscopicus TaxID=1912 RepID=UPI001FCCB3C0|nr:hypothetical protein [Streptomyces hygroscopicus]BDH10477.1 hypothetical protein HOK021_16560 [Streptomyces hygroscopicus]
MIHRPIHAPTNPICGEADATVPGRALRRATALGLALVLGTLAGCSGSSSEPKSKGSGQGQTKAGVPVRLPVPKPFDVENGWSTSAAPEAADTEAGSSGFPLVAVAAKSGLVVKAEPNGSRVQALSLTSGKTAWTFNAKALKGARTGVFVQSTRSGEKVILARQGKTSDSGLNKARGAVTVDIISADAPAKAAAVHHLDLVAPTNTVASFTATDSGFMVGSVDKGIHERSIVVDPMTGKQSSITAKTVTVPDCGSGSCNVAASPAFSTSAGVVTAFQQSSGCDEWDQGGEPCTYGFRVGNWSSTTVAPPGMHVGVPLGVSGRHLVAAWKQSSSQTDQPTMSDDNKTIIAVHDLLTGRIQAKAECSSADSLILQPGSAQSSTHTSPNGRYLVSGQVGFELGAGRGHCFSSTSAAKGVDLTAVGNDGTAYGIVHVKDETDAASLYGCLPIAEPGTNTPERDTARVSLREGKKTALPAAAEAPVYLAADGRGVFRTNNVLATYSVS